MSINGFYWSNMLMTFLSLVGVIPVIVYVFIILLNSMVHLTDLDYIFVFFLGAMVNLNIIPPQNKSVS